MCRIKTSNRSKSGKDKAIAGYKSVLAKKAKAKSAIRTKSDVILRGFGTEIIVNVKTFAKETVKVFSGSALERSDDTSDFKNIRGRHTGMVYCRLGEVGCDSISSLTSSKQKKRAELAVELCDFVAAGNKFGCTNDERITLFTTYFTLHPGILENISRNLNKEMFSPLTPSQSVQLKSLLRISTFKFRLLRVFFSNLNIKLFSSEGSMRKLAGQLLSYVTTNSECGTAELYQYYSSKKSTRCPYFRVKDLIKFVEDICKQSDLRYDEGFGGDIWILISGDKGGNENMNSMKFHFEILNHKNVGSVDNVHCFCFYKGSDRDEDMQKMFEPFVDPLKKMGSEHFKLCDRNIKLFLGGDFKFLCAMMGHQGSSATYPSIKDYVMLSHLQQHGGKPHTPTHCSLINDRKISDIVGSAEENIADMRTDVRKSGKDHMSIIRCPIFPLNDLFQLAPPILHINLGICLKLFNLLLKFVRKLDEEEGGNTFDYGAARKQYDYSERLLEMQKEISTLAH